MTIQTNRRKGKHSEDMKRLNRGDVMSLKNEIQPPPHHHHGDFKRTNKHSGQDVKKTEPKKPQLHVDLVTRFIKTSAECVSVKSEIPNKANLDHHIRLESMDFRKRIKDRYTFSLKKAPVNDEVLSKSNCIIQNGVKNEQRLRFQPVERRLRDKNHTKLNEIKNARKINIPVNKAISAIKIKQTVKSKDKDLVEKKNESLQTERTKEVKKINDKYRKQDIKAITSKQNDRVYKAVTFVEQKQPKPLEIRIPHKEVKLKAPNRSKIPILHVATVRTKSPTLAKRRQLSGKRKVIKRAQNASKSIETPPEVAIVPESVSPHTKPYYEAWVNKTLTATPKYSKKYKDYFDKTKVLQALKEMRMRKSSELTMHASSEQYAGTIRVRQKSKKEKN